MKQVVGGCLILFGVVALGFAAFQAYDLGPTLRASLDLAQGAHDLTGNIPWAGLSLPGAYLLILFLFVAVGWGALKNGVRRAGVDTGPRFRMAGLSLWIIIPAILVAGSLFRGNAEATSKVPSQAQTPSSDSLALDKGRAKGRLMIGNQSTDLTHAYVAGMRLTLSPIEIPSDVVASEGADAYLKEQGSTGYEIDLAQSSATGFTGRAVGKFPEDIAALTHHSSNGFGEGVLYARSDVDGTQEEPVFVDVAGDAHAKDVTSEDSPQWQLNASFRIGR